MPDEVLRRAESLQQELCATYGCRPEAVEVVQSPYRVCPLGAHVDHQLGLVCGMAIDRSLLLAFAPDDSRQVRLRSRDFSGEVRFPIDQVPPCSTGDWGNYPRGAVAALQEAYGPLAQGIVGILEGSLPIGGLSSSAAVGVAYLLALEVVNELEVSPIENIRLAQVIENGYIGLNNGILDQSMILLSRRGHLLSLDCQSEESESLPPAAGLPDFRIAVVYSGVTEALISTDYNRRVAECEEAAAKLLRAAGMKAPANPKLRHVPHEVFDAYANELPDNLRKRAAHFFGENARVRAGVGAWRDGDLAHFGELVSASGESSIINYDCGSPELTTIYKLLLRADGVYGARFSGAGFRGSCIALADPQAAESIEQAMRAEYARAFPQLADKFRVVMCDSDDGARLL